MVRNKMKDIIRLVLVFFFAISIPCKGEDVPIKGWIILSDNMDNAITTIKAAKGYKTLIPQHYYKIFFLST